MKIKILFILSIFLISCGGFMVDSDFRGIAMFSGNTKAEVFSACIDELLDMGKRIVDTDGVVGYIRAEVETDFEITTWVVQVMGNKAKGVNLSVRVSVVGFAGSAESQVSEFIYAVQVRVGLTE